jgi:hypothetical protein
MVALGMDVRQNRISAAPLDHKETLAFIAWN